MVAGLGKEEGLSLIALGVRGITPENFRFLLFCRQTLKYSRNTSSFYGTISMSVKLKLSAF